MVYSTCPEFTGEMCLYVLDQMKRSGDPIISGPPQPKAQWEIAKGRSERTYWQPVDSDLNMFLETNWNTPGRPMFALKYDVDGGNPRPATFASPVEILAAIEPIPDLFKDVYIYDTIEKKQISASGTFRARKLRRTEI